MRTTLVSRAVANGRSTLRPKHLPVTRAEDCFNQPIKIAQQQKATSLELRAATSLARLYKSHGREDKARQLPAQIYQRFTDGLETMDLREATALLDELR